MVEVTSLSNITNNVNAGNTDTNSTQNNEQNNQQNNNSGGCVYDKWGRTPDKSQICAIGIKSASADTQDGIVKCVFENKCAHCGQPALMWGWKWDGDSEKVQKFDGTAGTAEGHIYCVQSEGGCDADFSVEGNEHINGSTAKLTLVSGPTASSEEEAQQLSNGQLACDGSSASTGTGGSVGGSAVLIPDKTFYGLIKQILGAIDGVFIVANNMAYLLSFKDFYEYRNQFNDFIPKIERKDVLRDSLTKNWSTDGYYNAVEVTYADGIVKYQNDVLVKQYGENTFYYEFPEDDEETAKAKADALLAAHVRDYSTNIQLSIFYNENITEGSWVKVHKSLTEISGKTRKEIEQEDIKKTGKKIETKHKGINITNLTEKTIKKDDITKKLQIITDEEGDKFEIEVEDTDYELFFVQSYTCRWDEHNSLIMDLELKYGPDTPEDPINATVGTGGVATGGSTSGTALSGNIGQLVAQWIKGKTNDLDKAKAIHEGLKAYGVVYAYYCNFKYNTPDECLQHCQNPGLNCGDTAHLTMECMKQGGLNAHIELRCDSAHFFCVIEISGQKYYSDLTADSGQKSQRPWNEVWEGNTCGNPYSSISAGDGSC